MPKASDTVGGRLAQLRGAEPPAAFADRLGIHRNTLRRYEADEREPDAAFFKKLTRLGVNAQWLLTGEGVMTLTGDEAAAQEEMHGVVFDRDPKAIALREARHQGLPQFVRDREIEYAASANLVMVPHLGIELGAGSGRFAVKEERNGDLAFRVDLLRALGVSPKYAGLATVRGDSMLKVLHDSDVVLLDRSRGGTEIQSGGCYAFRLGEELLVKYLQRLPDGNIQAISENRDVFPPFTIAAKQFGDSVEIIGRVKSHNHKWT